ncbi:MAG: hypothetical protein AB7E79_16245 [Rhodospirillaceae bacterium]
MNRSERVLSLVDKLWERESAARAQHGLPLHHVLDIAQFPVGFSKDVLAELDAACAEWIATEPQQPNAYVMQAFTKATLFEPVPADSAIKIFQRLLPAEPFGAMRFSSAPESEVANIPEISGEMPRAGALYVGCDDRYFKNFGIALLRSLATVAPGAPIHVHLMAPSLAVLGHVNGLPLSLTVTYENPAAFIADHKITPNAYYHVARLLRFADIAAASDHPVWLLDADALVTRDPRALLDVASDMALRLRPGRIEPFNHVSACVVMGCKRSAAYFQAVGEIIRRGITKAWWGMDQYALFAAYLRCRPNALLVGPDVAEVGGITTDGVFSFTAGKNKAKLLTDQTPYATLFRRYLGIPA